MDYSRGPLILFRVDEDCGDSGLMVYCGCGWADATLQELACAALISNVAERLLEHLRNNTYECGGFCGGRLPSGSWSLVEPTPGMLERWELRRVALAVSTDAMTDEERGVYTELVQLFYGSDTTAAFALDGFATRDIL